MGLKKSVHKSRKIYFTKAYKNLGPEKSEMWLNRKHRLIGNVVKSGDDKKVVHSLYRCLKPS